MTHAASIRPSAVVSCTGDSRPSGTLVWCSSIAMSRIRVARLSMPYAASRKDTPPATGRSQSAATSATLRPLAHSALKDPKTILRGAGDRYVVVDARICE